jgi:hypothetical protein
MRLKNDHKEKVTDMAKNIFPSKFLLFIKTNKPTNSDMIAAGM